MASSAFDKFYENVRETSDERVWGAAVKLARDGAVVGVSDDGDEIHLRVKSRGKPTPHEVYLWPTELDWGCDCELASDVCVHVCAATIAVHQTRATAAATGAPATVGTGAAAEAVRALPQPKKQFQVRLQYAFISEGTALSLKRRIAWPDGRSEPLDGALAQTDIIATRADAQIEAILIRQTEPALDPDLIRRILALLPADTHATLDGAPIRIVADPVLFRVRLSDEGEGFKAALVRPAPIDALFRGAAKVGDTLRPTSHGQLTADQKRLLTKGVVFEPHEVGRLVGDYLPKLRERIPVAIDTERLPNGESLKPRVLLALAERDAGLEVRAELVYGDPPVAKIEGGTLKATGKTVPARDLAQERLVVAEFERDVGMPIGYKQVLAPDRAAQFLRERLPRHKGIVQGSVDERRFRIVDTLVAPEITVRSAAGTGAAWELDVRFTGASGTAEPRAVLAAWASGRTLVPLLEGGYAQLPVDWLQSHGALLRELLESRDPQGRVDRNSTAALVELLEDTQADVPMDLRRLRQFLEGNETFSDDPLPPGFIGELRHYQEGGYRWMRFLRGVELNGILADDMGLGKTIQAIAAMIDVGGQHLVVAPTSVLKNWEREANRFAPGMKVNIYHGPQRKLDDSQITLTSYALLRLDVELLKQREWTYAILDEAQAIKNPDSQTARAARQIRARHRLCLTGTPVENRLEELWSLFRYLMPGFLGSVEAFRERFARPIENGDPKARDALRKRVQPYILRRLKQQVAKELPPLTDMVVRCEMGADQRRVYDAVRMAAREDVQRAIAERGVQGATMQVLEALLRMRQACCDPLLLPGEVGVGAGSCKLERLEELLVEMACDDHKALIFSQWTSLLDLVEKRLEKLGIPWVRLDGSTRDRQTVIDNFQSPEGPPVFLLSLKAGGTGLNLTAADYVVHLDPWWNPAVQQQATDRAHRIGQDKPVVSCRLIAEGTVEERILELQDAKKALADAALGTEGGFLRALSAEELRSLFDAA